VHQYKVVWEADDTIPRAARLLSLLSLLLFQSAMPFPSTRNPTDYAQVLEAIRYVEVQVQVERNHTKNRLRSEVEAE
jgi:hypothetical protein